MKNALYYFAFLFLVSSCSSNKSLKPTDFKPLNEEWNYLVFDGNTFIQQEIQSPPLVDGGNKNFMIKLYQSIRYPSKARNKKIQGTVLVSVIIDELGQMESVVVKKGLGYGCDEQSLRAVKIACKLDMKPAVSNDKKVKVKFDVPVNYKLYN